MAFGKSVLYLCGLGTFSYVLLKLVSPDEETIRKELTKVHQEHKSEDLKKRQAFLDVLRGAAQAPEPMYRQSKEQIDIIRDKAVSQPKKP